MIARQRFLVIIYLHDTITNMMDYTEKEQLRGKIESAIVDTEKDIASLKELTKPIAPDNAIGRLSRMEAIGTKSINEANFNSAKSKLAKLKYALANIDAPDFGTCMDCGEPIPVRRIMVMPESVFCVNCAE